MRARWWAEAHSNRAKLSWACSLGFTETVTGWGWTCEARSCYHLRGGSGGLHFKYHAASPNVIGQAMADVNVVSMITGCWKSGWSACWGSWSWVSRSLSVTFKIESLDVGYVLWGAALNYKLEFMLLWASKSLRCICAAVSFTLHVCIQPELNQPINLPELLVPQSSLY